MKKYVVEGYDKDYDTVVTYHTTNSFSDAVHVGEILNRLTMDDSLIRRDDDGIAEPIDWIQIYDEPENKVIGYFDRKNKFVHK